MLASAERAEEPGIGPLARITANAAHSVDPDVFGEGPVVAVERALAKSGKSLADVTTMELNEAFAAQSLACIRQWGGIDPEIVNPWGGAIAVSHQLKRAGSGVGVASLCVGVGQGTAVILDR